MFFLSSKSNLFKKFLFFLSKFSSFLTLSYGDNYQAKVCFIKPYLIMHVFLTLFEKPENDVLDYVEEFARRNV